MAEEAKEEETMERLNNEEINGGLAVRRPRWRWSDSSCIMVDVGVFSQVLKAGKRHSGGGRLVDLGNTTPPARSSPPHQPPPTTATALLIPYASSTPTWRLTHARGGTLRGVVEGYIRNRGNAEKNHSCP